MKSGRGSIVVCAALAVAVAFPAIGKADDQDKRRPIAVRNAIVHFGQPQPQTPAPAPVGNVVTHFLDPDDVTIRKDGTVTFVVNGGGHGIAIYPVSRNTTRDDIAADLCQGGVDEADRAGRNAVCNGTIATGVPNPQVAGNPLVIGTQNLRYKIVDGRKKLIIDTGFNPPFPRVDDPTDRLLSTSGAIPGATGLDANPAGAFLVGTVFVPETPTTPAAITPGNRIQVTFEDTGRFLVICQNRGHYLNDHMFGFVNVVDDDDHGDNSGHGGQN